MNSKQRYNAKRAAMHRETKAAERRMGNGIVTSLMGCSMNVAKALTLPTLREKTESTATCLPQVAIYNAGFRKPVDKFSAR